MRCFPDIADDVVIEMRGSTTWMTHTLNRITDLRPITQIQCEALAHGCEGIYVLPTVHVYPEISDVSQRTIR